MLDLDEMKQQWVQYDRKLNESIRLNRQLLNATNLNGARSALRRMAAFMVFQTVVWLAIVVALGSYIFEHLAMLRLALPAALLDLFAIGMFAATIRQILAAQQIDYGGTVAAMQRQVETLRALRIRTTQWALLAGALVWAPFVVVVAEAFFGLEDYSAAWLSTNVVFGLSLIPLAVWSSRKFGDRLGQWPFVQQLMKDVAGHNLNAAESFLARLSEFEDA
jgi:hypothetical protein